MSRGFCGQCGGPYSDDVPCECQSKNKEGVSVLEPCCICQKDWNAPNDIIDTVYPQIIRYFGEDGPVYSWLVVCQLHNTGCGRMVFGDSREDAIDNWNHGLTDVITRF